MYLYSFQSATILPVATSGPIWLLTGASKLRSNTWGKQKGNIHLGDHSVQRTICKLVERQYWEECSIPVKEDSRRRIHFLTDVSNLCSLLLGYAETGLKFVPYTCPIIWHSTKPVTTATCLSAHKTTQDYYIPPVQRLWNLPREVVTCPSSSSRWCII